MKAEQSLTPSALWVQIRRYARCIHKVPQCPSKIKKDTCLKSQVICLSRAPNYQICICVSLTCVTNEPEFHFERTNQVLSENPAFLMFCMLVCTKLRPRSWWCPRLNQVCFLIFLSTKCIFCRSPKTNTDRLSNTLVFDTWLISLWPASEVQASLTFPSGTDFATYARHFE